MVEVASVPQIFVIFPDLIMRRLLPGLIKFNDLVEAFTGNLKLFKSENNPKMVPDGV